MRKIKNVLFLIAFFFIIKLMISCGKDNHIYPVYTFNYTTLEVSARSVWYSNINYDTVTVDKVNRNRMRLTIMISDSLKSEYSFFSKAMSSIKGFETASASEPRISRCFAANQKIKGIKIYTLQDFNDSIRSGDEVSNEFLVDNGKVLYTTIPNADKILNKNSLAYAFNEISLVCKVPAKTATARFRVKVVLSDNRVLEAETLPILFIEKDEN